MMKRFLIVFLGIVVIAAVSGNELRAQNIPLNELPEEIEHRLERAVEGTGFEVRNVQKGQQDGTVYYRGTARNSRNDRLNIILNEEGGLIDRYQEDAFRIKDGRLYYERSPFRIQTILTSYACDPDLEMKGIVSAVSAVSKVGCNTIAGDLHGWNADGTAISDESVEFINYVIGRLGGSGGIKLIIRVLGEGSPKSPEGRLNAVTTAAETFKHYPNLIYVIDGKDSLTLARTFKSIAPNLVVASPAGGDIGFVASEKEIFMNKYLNKPDMYFQTMPDAEDTGAHIILADEEKSYAWFDRKNAYPIEFEPWEPDNSVLSEEERAAGFISLFNKRNLDGWTVMGRNKSGFQVIDGVIEYVERGGGGLQTRDRYDHFILRYEYKIGEGANNGVHLRAPRSNRASKIGFEIQMYGDYGREPNKNSTGAVYDVVAPTLNPSKPAGEWNTVEIIAAGPFLRVTMNGQLVQNLNFNEIEELKYRLRDGFFRITDHNDYVAYRNIRIKRLDG